MVTDAQVRKLMKLIREGKSLGIASAKVEMDEKTARSYLRTGKLPNELQSGHGWRTREDPFKEVWEEVKEYLEKNPGLEAKTLFEHLQRQYAGRYQDGQLRTLQRRVKIWRALEGASKEVMFPQEHKPGRLCESDFTRMNALGITIGGEPFEHLLYHFVLTYSNWETGTVCFTESFEALSEGFQKALWELGGVPWMHRTDRLSAAVRKPGQGETFTRSYQALLDHYGMEGQSIQAGKANENGDVEQRHNRFKRAVAQALMLRGSSDFEDPQAYEAFLGKLLSQLNSGRLDRLAEERQLLRGLPADRLDSWKRMDIRVRPSSTIRIYNNVYSVDSRLIGEKVQVHLYADRLEIWYAQRKVDVLPRLSGDNKHRIDYRHIIAWLVRKPGAFENYRYREEMFPTHRFRRAYDELCRSQGKRAAGKYLGILHLAAHGNEAAVDEALRHLLNHEEPLGVEIIEQMVCQGYMPASPRDIEIPKVDLVCYDALLSLQEVQP